MMQQALRNSNLIIDLLGMHRSVPLTAKEMAEALKVTFYPPHERTRRLDAFSAQLKTELISLGVTVIPYEEALIPDTDGKIKPGIAIIEQGEGGAGRFAVDHITSLYENPLIALFDGPCPVEENHTLQETLDAIVGVLAWNLTHIPIFVEDDRWTICTMNGSVIRCGSVDRMRLDVGKSLVPKLAGQVIPPKRSDIQYREGSFDIEKAGLLDVVRDYEASARIWRKNGLMLAHTSVESLATRSRFYQRLLRAYIDNRTGMSYGFMVRQLPIEVQSAVERKSAPDGLKNHHWDESAVAEWKGRLYGCIETMGKEWIVEIPDVWLLSTRSGCDKTNLNPREDIIRMGLVRGEVVVDTPVGLTASECRPSYDTLVMLAHALGNAFSASILKSTEPESPFPEVLESAGLSMSHWHGYPFHKTVPAGFRLHGESNPPVSCSTPQSAIYAFTGKIQALESSLRQGDEYLGDVHVEPHHGTNITGLLSLTETAEWVDRQYNDARLSGDGANSETTSRQTPSVSVAR